MGKVLCITHTDLDGVGAAIAVRQARKDDAVETRFLNYDRIGEVLEVNPSEWDAVYITDISSKEMYDKFKDAPNVFMFDHHLRGGLGAVDDGRNFISPDAGCATEIANRKLGAGLDRFAGLVGIADLYKRDDPWFAEAQDMSSLCYLFEGDAGLRYAYERFFYQRDLQPVSVMERSMLLAMKKERDRLFAEMRKQKVAGNGIMIWKEGRGVGSAWLVDKLLYGEGYDWYGAVMTSKDGVFASFRSKIQGFDFGDVLRRMNPKWSGHPKAAGAQVADVVAAEKLINDIATLLEVRNL